MVVWNRKYIIFLLLAVTMIGALLVYGNKIRKRRKEEMKEQYLLEQQQLKQELEPLMEKARKVMRGEETASGKLSLYNFDQDAYKDVVYVDADVDIVVVEINGDEGEMVVEYYIHRFDKTGKKVSWDEGLACVWVIAKDTEGNWTLVDVPDPVGGEDEVREADKLMKKMYKYGIKAREE